MILHQNNAKCKLKAFFRLLIIENEISIIDTNEFKREDVI